MTDIYQINVKGSKQHYLKVILDKLSNNQELLDDDQALTDMLCSITAELDELDSDDFFGTEGWEHSFGLRD